METDHSGKLFPPLGLKGQRSPSAFNSTVFRAGGPWRGSWPPPNPGAWVNAERKLCPGSNL